MREFIESGIIEAYVLVVATDEEIREVERLSETFAEVREAIDRFSINIEQQARLNAIAPDRVIKPFLMATVNYIKRLENGEEVSFPPLLNSSSTIKDFAHWIERPDMVLSKDSDDIYAKILGNNNGVVTAIVWLKNMAHEEVHHREYERFLVLEGTCNIIIEEETYSLHPGGFFEIPLYKNHVVKVTSVGYCKVILQRVAA